MNQVRDKLIEAIVCLDLAKAEVSPQTNIRKARVLMEDVKLLYAIARAELDRDGE